MAYFCLTFVEKVVFEDQDAAAKRRISSNVLKKLRHLADVGDNQTARKAGITAEGRRPHTPAELAWLEKAVQVLIKRIAEYAFDVNATRTQVTMADLRL